jgi:hypothetical protein
LFSFLFLSNIGSAIVVLQKVHHRQFQNPLHRWFWPSLVKVASDSWVITASCKVGSSIVHHHWINVQYGGVVGCLHRRAKARFGDNWSHTTPSFADDPVVMMTTKAIGCTI